jgi:2-polyprenyl-3-methyl-5-hydroxy-6-metoxy-1,4-benzoquinol methylase
MEALMSLDHQTSKVVEMYNRYPFPSKGNYNSYFETFVLPTIVELKKSCRISRLLDAGCGTGNISVDMARHLPDVEITAIDLTDESLRMAQSKAMSLQLKNIEFQKSNLLEYNPNSKVTGENPS